MADLLAAGELWLTQKLGAYAAVTITYARDAQSATITDATAGRTVFASNQPGRARIEFGERDYLIPVASFPTATLTEPARHDRITETINGTAMTFEVMAPAGEPAWRWSDVSRTCYRIHAKRVS